MRIVIRFDLLLFIVALYSNTVFSEDNVSLLIRKLESDDFSTREEAAKLLKSLGAVTLKPLNEAARSEKSVEIKNRISEILEYNSTGGLEMDGVSLYLSSNKNATAYGVEVIFNICIRNKTKGQKLLKLNKMFGSRIDSLIYKVSKGDKGSLVGATVLGDEHSNHLTSEDFTLNIRGESLHKIVVAGKVKGNNVDAGMGEALMCLDGNTKNMHFIEAGENKFQVLIHVITDQGNVVIKSNIISVNFDASPVEAQRSTPPPK
jgi:hypothetical protein